MVCIIKSQTCQCKSSSDLCISNSKGLPFDNTLPIQLQGRSPLEVMGLTDELRRRLSRGARRGRAASVWKGPFGVLCVSVWLRTEELLTDALGRVRITANMQLPTEAPELLLLLEMLRFWSKFIPTPCSAGQALYELLCGSWRKQRSELWRI